MIRYKNQFFLKEKLSMVFERDEKQKSIGDSQLVL